MILDTALRELRDEAERIAINRAKEIIRAIAGQQKVIESAQAQILKLQKDLVEIKVEDYE
jgi:hypothetical protein